MNYALIEKQINKLLIEKQEVEDKLTTQPLNINSLEKSITIISKKIEKLRNLPIIYYTPDPFNPDDTGIPTYPEGIPEPLPDIELPIGNLTNNYDIIRKRNNQSDKYYYADEDTDFSRGNILRFACDEAKDGDVLELGYGTFDINASKPLLEGGKGALVFPMGVTIKGKGIDNTILFAKKDGDGRSIKDQRTENRLNEINSNHNLTQIEKEAEHTLENKKRQIPIKLYEMGMAFQLTNTKLENLTLECKSDSQSEDAITVGYFFPPSWIQHKNKIIEDYSDKSYEEFSEEFYKNPIGIFSINKLDFTRVPSYRKKLNEETQEEELIRFNSTLYKSKIISNAWGFYSWNNLGDSCTIKECQIVSAHQGISLMGSGAINKYKSTDGKINIMKTEFIIDNSNTTVDGAVNHKEFGGTYGVISCGAQTTVEDCQFTLTNNSRGRCIGISDTFHDERRNSLEFKIISKNNNFTLEAPDTITKFAHFKSKSQSSFEIESSSGIDAGLTFNLQ